jgi:phage-related tail fiber protein
VSATVPGYEWYNNVQEELLAVIEGQGLNASDTDRTQLRQAISKMIAIALPAGVIIHIAQSTAPSGYLKANGAAVSRTAYATLFAAIGTTFGVGDGSTTFNLPDLRGEFVRGWDDSRGLDTGRTFGSVQTDAMQGHYHNSHYSVGQSVGTGGNTYAEYVTSGNNAGPITDIVRAAITDGANGTPRTAAETRPHNVALLACIKY